MRENKREMTINFPNLFWQKCLSESAGDGVSEPPGRKIFGGIPIIINIPSIIKSRFIIYF